MATQYYRYNELTRVLTAEPRYIVTIDGRTIVNPTAAQYAELRDAYPKGEDAPLPEPQEGKVVEYNGYSLGEDNKWHKQWTLVDAPPKPPRTFSKYKLVAALMQAQVWPQVKAWIESVPGAYDLYLAAEDISEDEQLLKDGIAEVKKLLGWTDEQVEAVLAASAI
jgi:hypothetical protein